MRLPCSDFDLDLELDADTLPDVAAAAECECGTTVTLFMFIIYPALVALALRPEVCLKALVVGNPGATASPKAPTPAVGDGCGELR